jgi:Fungal specific transcription factor domain
VVTTFRSERFQRALIDCQSQDLQMKALSHIILSDVTSPKAQCLPFVSLPYMEHWDFIDPLVGLSPHLMCLIARTTEATFENQQQSATELYAEVERLHQSVRGVPPVDVARIWAIAETYRLGALLYIQCRLEGWAASPPFLPGIGD